MWRRSGIGVAVWLACWPAPSHGQALEVTPFVGYRFGGGFFERVTGQPVDLDGARAVGAVVNVRVGDGLFAEALVTHQAARVTVRGRTVRSAGGLADSRSITGRAERCRSSGAIRACVPSRPACSG